MHFVPHVDAQVMGGLHTSLLVASLELSVLNAIGQAHALAEAIVIV